MYSCMWWQWSSLDFSVNDAFQITHMNDNETLVGTHCHYIWLQYMNSPLNNERNAELQQQQLTPENN